MTKDEIEMIAYFRKVRNDLRSEICTSGFYEKYNLDEIINLLKEKEKEVLAGFIQKNIKI